MLSDSELNSFIDGGHKELAITNSAIKLVEASIYRAQEKPIPFNLPFSEVFFGYSKKRNQYHVVGELHEGQVVLVFSEKCTDASFRTNDNLTPIHPNDYLIKLLKAIIASIRSKCDILEHLIVDTFTSETHYGNLDELTQEFIDYFNNELARLSHAARLQGAKEDISEVMPLDMNITPSNLLEYLVLRDGNLDNIHETHNK